MRAVQTSKTRRRAFTLIEVAIALGLSVLAFAAVASMFLYGCRSTAIIGNYSDLNRLNINALDQMSTDIRQADSVLLCSNNLFEIQAVDINTGATNALTYTYSPTGQTLTRTYEGATTILLTGIVTNSLQFTMYQRNPIGGSVSNYVTTNVAICKVVQISWKCSRSILGIGQTESAQSCEIVIRKE
jgi:Tfp pilus assembly protein PilW